MPSFDESKDKVLSAAQGSNPIGDILGPKADSYRLEIRKALQSRRVERFPKLAAARASGIGTPGGLPRPDITRPGSSAGPPTSGRAPNVAPGTPPGAGGGIGPGGIIGSSGYFDNTGSHVFGPPSNSFNNRGNPDLDWSAIMQRAAGAGVGIGTSMAVGGGILGWLAGRGASKATREWLGNNILSEQQVRGVHTYNNPDHPDFVGPPSSAAGGVPGSPDLSGNPNYSYQSLASYNPSGSVTGGGYYKHATRIKAPSGYVPVDPDLPDKTG